ncbi:MAG TPA: hypothetical protein VJM46_03955 [Candidatus Saccharimonadales bacterium]|nr:hypothetical protein [Candidatus Saccharimonadales bacterium]
MAESKKKFTAKKPAKKERVSLKIRVKRTFQKIFVRTPKNPHHSFKMTKPKMYVTTADLRATWRLLGESWAFIGRHKRIMLGLGLIYAVLGYILVGGISQMDYVSFKEGVTEFIDGDLGAFETAFSLFGSALTGGLVAPPTDLQQFLSTSLLLFFWLSLVWAARMLTADKEITMRDALYNSGAPIVPTLVMLSIIAVQLIPAALGIFGYATALNGGWLTGGVEAMAFGVAALLLCLLSAYFVVSSVTGLIVVTLPGTYPWQALRTARQLVMNRRWGIILRILVMVVQMVVVWGVVMIPIFLLDNWLRFDWLPLVPIFVQALMGLTVVYTSVYIYRLYRSLL